MGGNTITISGTPSAAGTFNYTIPLDRRLRYSQCYRNDNSKSDQYSRCGLINSYIVHQHTTYTDNAHHSGATGIGTATGLPAGVTAAWAANTITISGTPSASGTFNYTIPLTGGCGTVNATGTITVTPANTVGSGLINTDIVYQHGPYANHTYHNRGNRNRHSHRFTCRSHCGMGSNTITISGTPSAAGTFNYTIPLTGGCGTVNATGTITVTPANTVGAASSTPTLCIDTALTPITHTLREQQE